MKRWNRGRRKRGRRKKVEHSIGVLKRVFGFTKVPYRGWAKTCTGSWWPAPWASVFMAPQTPAARARG